MTLPLAGETSRVDKVGETAPGEMVKVFESTVISSEPLVCDEVAALVAVKALIPASWKLIPVKVATPLTALTLAVPRTVPIVGEVAARLSVMTTLESGPALTTLLLA